MRRDSLLRQTARASLTTTSIVKYVPLNLQHHDSATLFAGKLHAVLQREYLKGRDVYDLWWYLAQPNWPDPNLAHLNQNLRQSGWEGELLTVANWQSVVRERLQPLSWRLVLEDVEPFVIDGNWQQAFNKDRLLSLLDQGT